MTNRIDSIIIGAGQAGLAMGYHLSNRGHPYIILEKEDVMASAWRHRWDSFTLVTPNWTLNMPDFPYQEDDPEGFLARDEIVTYLESFAGTFEPPIQYGTLAEKLEMKSGYEGFLLSTTEGVYRSSQRHCGNRGFSETQITSAGQ